MVWILALCAAAIAAPERSYETRNLMLFLDIPVGETARIRSALKAELAPHGIKRVTLVQEDGSTETVRLGKLRAHQSLAVITIVAFKARGAEVDLMVEGIDARHYPVTVWWEGDLRIASGDPVEHAVVALRTPKSLREDYGISPLISSEDRSWDPRSAALLGGALDLLSDDELALISDVPFKRVAHASEETQKMVGIQKGESLYAAFLVDGEGPRVEVYDQALSPSMRFVGDPWDPKPDALRTLLHEIAHTLAFTDYRAMARDVVHLIAEHDALRDKTLPHVDEMNALVEQYNERPVAGLLQTIRTMETELTAYKIKAEALEVQIEGFKPMLKIKPTTAAALAYEQVLGGQAGPTWYANRSIEEGFAECYSLYLADPAALERALPQVHAWFAGGAYLAYLERPASH